jgi:5-methylcytosine-specific restriction endonuclease McrA
MAGLPCGVCGQPTASTYGVCGRSLECSRERDRRRYAENPQRRATVKEGRERRLAADSDRVRELARNSGRKWRASNLEKVRASRRESMRKWRAANLEVTREGRRDYDRQWRTTMNPGAPRAARLRYLKRRDRPCRSARAGCIEFAAVGSVFCPECDRRDCARRHARRRDRIARRLAQRQEGICTWCSHPLPLDLAKADIDHIIPKASGLIIEDEWNLQMLHRACNGAKGGLMTGQAITLAAERGITLPTVAAAA